MSKPNRETVRAGGGAFLLAAWVLLVPACLVTSDVETEMEGREISEETLSLVKPGMATADVTRLLGPPPSKTVLEDGSEIWKWSYREVREEKGAVLLLFSKEKRSVRSGSVYVEIRDGRVVRTWRDGFAQAGHFRTVPDS